MHTAMPIGIDDFKEAREGYYIVDKTSFLSRFFPGHPKVTLITRPRRFGKTMTLSMLRYFFDCEGAEEHRKLFDGMAVSQDTALMKEMGTRPVLFFSMRGWKATDWDAMQETITNGLQQVAQQHKYLLQSNRVDPADRQFLQRMYDGSAPISSLRTAPARLLQMLEAHDGKKAVFLLDEYDVPIQSAWEHGYYDEAIDFFRAFLTTSLKSNLSLDFAVLTGVLRISKESIFSDLNNLDVDSILHPKYPTVLGFTSEEVEKIADDLGRADRLPELREWYDGYRIAGHEIYNPWSVVKYFDRDCQPETYWVNTSGNAILGEMLHRAVRKTLDALQSLIQGGSIRASLSDEYIYSDIFKNKNVLYAMLLATGYLTTKMLRSTELGLQAELILPNRELRSIFRIEVLERYQSDEADIEIPELMQAFVDGDIETVQEGLSEYLVLLTSSFDAAKGREAFYHGFVLGMTAVLTEDYVIRSNRESGYGRYDIAATPKDTSRPGFIIECKLAEPGESLEDKADLALRQIEEKHYDAELVREGVKVIHRYGIAFSGKKLCAKIDE